MAEPMAGPRDLVEVEFEDDDQGVCMAAAEFEPLTKSETESPASARTEANHARLGRERL